MKFIQAYENALNAEECQSLMKYIEREVTADKGVYQGAQQFNSALGRKDYAVFIPPEDPVLNKVKGSLTKAMEEYYNKFNLNDYISPLVVQEYKGQKTPIGGQYSVWHCEDDNPSREGRVLAWAIYLNTIKKGGETEFLYQGHRQEAVQGTLVIWPTYTEVILLMTIVNLF